MSLNDEKFTLEDLKETSALFQYSQNDLEKILKSYEKTPETLLEDVKIIKEWLKTQSHFPHHPTSRQIASFLVNNKCSIEKTKQKIDMSFTIRCLIPEFYHEIYPKSKKVHQCFEYSYVICLPKLTKELNRLIIFSYLHGNEVLDSETIAGICFSFMELMTFVDFVNGYEIIVDLTQVTFTLGAKFTPMVLKKILHVIEKVYSGRLNALKFVNVPKVLEFIIDIVMGVFKDKLKSRLEFLQGYDKLKKYYGDNLPNEFGGKSGSLDKLQGDYKNFLESYNDYFTKLQNIKIDESLRPEKLQNDDFLGYYGNFKKLNID